MIGSTIGKWTVILDGGKNIHSQKLWTCKCTCGATKDIREDALNAGRSKSCKSCRELKC
jgi:hypothetical protein